MKKQFDRNSFASGSVKRRNFLAATGGVLAALSTNFFAQAQNSSSHLIHPKALRPGDTVGLITPATYVADPDQLALAERTLRYFKLRVKMGRNVGKRAGYFGNPVSGRLDDFHAMFRDTEVRAVFCVRGGYGTAQLLDRIDYDLVRRNPKIFLGYSDITALHLAINKLARLVTFHGPVALSRFSLYTQNSFRQSLFQTAPIVELTNPAENDLLRPAHTLRAVRPGAASGRLIGGNLTLVSTTLGTPYEIDTRDAILFLEDVDEEPYRIDRMLTHLRLAGKFKNVRGIIFGECKDCRASDYKPSLSNPYSLGEVLDNAFGELKVPVLSGLAIGHTDDQLTLPLGVAATLDADKGTLTLRESGVVPA